MNTLRLAPRCLARPVNTLSSTPRTQLPLPNTHLLHPAAASQQVRHRSWFGWGSKKDEDLQKPSAESRSLKELLKASPKTTNNVVPQLERGGLSKSSIFGDEEAAPASGKEKAAQTLSDKEYIAIVDPTRAYAWTWPQRFEARQHHRRGRLTKKMQILQTEKSHTAKSHWIKTSVKKLAPLARQVAGMTLNDAIVQMRFSPKKASSELLGHLTDARAEAMLRRDMNPDEMYIDQAWVGRGTYEKELSHRARGRIDMLRKPYTSITVVLKEEATRKRLAKEAAEKVARKKVWVQLPNKPIPGQQQYYQW
ncbi:ribosomal protein L22/L17 [Peziza echinospora]|nr:ribosomal protein L22/L17 [Peziza echinospora]